MSHVERMKEEYKELCERINKAQNFMLGALFDSLPNDEQKLLRWQFDSMLAYRHWLGSRLNKSSGEKLYPLSSL